MKDELIKKEELKAFALEDEDLASVSGGASASGQRTIVVCPSCHVEKTYGNLIDVCKDIMAHYKHLESLGIIDSSQDNTMVNYAKRLWDAAAPVEE